MAYAASRAEAEDIVDAVAFDLEELPALADAFAARERRDVRIHEHWDDNLFLTLTADNGFDEHSRTRRSSLNGRSISRQAMVPMEGKGALAYWDDRAGQLVVYSSTQVPHIIRSGACEFSTLDRPGPGPRHRAGRRRRLRLQVRPSARRTVRRLAGAEIPPRRSAMSRTAGNISSPAPIAASTTTNSPPMPMRTAGCSLLDARHHRRRRRLFGLAVHRRPRAGADRPAICPALMMFSGYRCKHAVRGDQQAGRSCLIEASRAPASASPSS